MIRRIAAGEGELLREVRLQALTDSPTAFGSTAEEAASRPPSWWRDAAERRSAGASECTFFAVADGQVVGIVGGYRPDNAADLIQLISMWVAPEARRNGLGALLVSAVVEWASDAGASTVELWVTAGNEPAIALYERLGFRMTTGRQPLPSHPDLEEIRMVLELTDLTQSPR